MITAVISRKGGVGKTTTAVNLAAALAERDRRVLLVDLDSQASSSMSLGVSPDQLSPSSADLLLRSARAADVVRPTTIANLSLITASVDLMDADAQLGNYRGRHLRLRSVLQPVADTYDDILLDCPPGLAVVPTNAIVAAHNFLVPTTPQFLATAGLRNLIAAAERMSWDSGGRIQPLGILLTMVDYRTKLTRRQVDQVRSDYGSLVFAIEVRINTRLAEAPEEGRSIFQHDPHAKGAEAYRLLAEEFLLRSREVGRRG
jgi:chromosome partitioning protein